MRAFDIGSEDFGAETYIKTRKEPSEEAGAHNLLISSFHAAVISFLKKKLSVRRSAIR